MSIRITWATFFKKVESNLIGLGWSPRFFIPNKLPCDTDTAGVSNHTLNNKVLDAPWKSAQSCNNGKQLCSYLSILLWSRIPTPWASFPAMGWSSSGWLWCFSGDWLDLESWSYYGNTNWGSIKTQTSGDLHLKSTQERPDSLKDSCLFLGSST